VGFCINVIDAKKLKMNIGTEITLKINFEDREIEGTAVVKNIREIGKNVCYGTEFSHSNRNF